MAGEGVAGTRGRLSLADVREFRATLTLRAVSGDNVNRVVKTRTPCLAVKFFQVPSRSVGVTKSEIASL